MEEKLRALQPALRDTFFFNERSSFFIQWVQLAWNEVTFFRLGQRLDFSNTIRYINLIVGGYSSEASDHVPDSTAAGQKESIIDPAADRGTDESVESGT
jgi:hypothetical protein